MDDEYNVLELRERRAQPIGPRTQLQARHSKAEAGAHPTNETDTLIKEEAKADLWDNDIGIAEELYHSILSVLQSIWSVRTELGDQATSLEPILTSFILWGREFKNGKLTCILLRVEALHDKILSLLQELGALLYTGKQA